MCTHLYAFTYSYVKNEIIRNYFVKQILRPIKKQIDIG
jgi:hypothetical protein